MKRKKIRAELLRCYCKPLQNQGTSCITIEITPICVIGLGSVLICFKNEMHFLQ